jgi:hypothetical protein
MGMGVGMMTTSSNPTQFISQPQIYESDGQMNPLKIDSYRDSDIIQVCHIQVASRDSDVFEYAIDQVRDHVAR